MTFTSADGISQRARGNTAAVCRHARRCGPALCRTTILAGTAVRRTVTRGGAVHKGDCWDLLFEVDDLGVSEVRFAAAPELADGAVRLAVERFGLSANNVTYARLGASIMPYWK